MRVVTWNCSIAIDRGSTQKVTFTPKPGVSRFYCQPHPAYVGGQVVML